MKKKERAEIRDIRILAQDIISMTLLVSFAEDVKAGQFVSLFPEDAARLLPRPISIADADPENGTIRLVFRIAGAGTREIAGMREGQKISVLGPLGNGFPVSEAEGKKLILAGGGIGIPPMLLAAKAAEGMAAEIVHADGWRNRETFLLDDLRRTGRVLIATDDGSVGVHGTVLDALLKEEAEGAKGQEQVIFACGPRPMLRALKDYARKREIPLYVSMEERMACGVGVCLGCVAETEREDAHSKVRNARVCTDGPVFDAREVVL